MKQVLIRKGRVFTAELPSPQIEPGMARVITRASCISPGTERMGIESSAKSLLQRGLEQPEKVLKAIREMKQMGIYDVLRKAREKFDVDQVTGYSASGVVVEVGGGLAGDFQVGDPVAVAGAAYAMHAAELIVPRNLMVKIPDGVSFEQASTVALGAIAMQGVRRAQPTLGEYVVVLGCGALGLLTVQILRAAGCRVVAIDLDPARLTLAAGLGAEISIQPGVQDPVRVVQHFTNGYGSDAVIVTASTASNEPLQQAFGMCRRKGRVVLVGVVGREFDREAMYAKELDFIISTSYGPGRYDEQYERWGLDYPYGHVRWTEKRNMEAYLRLLANGSIRINELISGRYPVEQAEQAYASLSNQGAALAIIEYPEPVLASSASQSVESTLVTSVPGVGYRTVEKMRLAIVGAGSFVRSTHLSNLRELIQEYHVSAVVNRSGVSARNAASGFSGCHVETDLSKVLAAGDVDAVLIGTRHHLHASQALQSIRAGKAVFLEKPMCLNETECAALKTALDATSSTFMVGYNRRFSPFAMEINCRLQDRINPVLIHYTMNAGYLPYDHWTQTAEGGGRLIGEACHIFDLFRFIISAPVKSISVDAINPNTSSVRSSDNFVATVTYQDGSLATLLYTSVGHPAYQKERMEVFCDERVMIMDDYLALHEYGQKEKHSMAKRQDKGHLAELQAFHRAWIEGVRFPIPLNELLETWEITRQLASAVG